MGVERVKTLKAVQNSSLIKLFAGLTALIFVAVAVLNFWKLTAPEAAKPPPVLTKAQDYSASYKPPAPRAVKPKLEPELESDATGLPKLPRDKAEAWLAKRNRNAASLLAVFRARGDTNYLHEAATNFPNDPQVQLAVLSRNAFPGDRRKWLDLFLASSPSNSLADYFSAGEYFKNGKTVEAVRELLAASGKDQFQTYSLETLLNGEELYSDSGISSREASIHAMADMAEENLPQLADFKVIAQGIGEAMKQEPASVSDLAQLGLDFSGKINSGDSGKFLINQMVGTAIEKNLLSQLEQNTAYDFLDGQTPAQVAEAIKQQKIELRKLMTDFAPAQLQMMMSESETAIYMQRMKIYGELDAMKWVIQQHPPADTQK